MTHIQVHVARKAAGSTTGSPTTSHEDFVKHRQRASDSDDSSEKEAPRQSSSDSDEAGKSKAKRATLPLSSSSSEEDTTRGNKKPTHRGSGSDSEDVKTKHPKTTGFVVAARDVNADGHNATKEDSKRATPQLSPSSSEDVIGEKKKHTHRGSASDSDDAKAKHPRTSRRRRVVESTFVVAAHDANAAEHNATHPQATSDVSALDADDVAKAGTAVAAAAAAAAVAMRLADQRSVDEPDVAQRARQCVENPHVACIVVALGVLLVYCLLRK